MTDYQIGDTVTLTEKSTGSTLVREVLDLPYSGPGVCVAPGEPAVSLIKLTQGAWEITAITPKVQSAPSVDGLYYDAKNKIWFEKQGNQWLELTYGSSDDGGWYPVWQVISKETLDFHTPNLARYVRADSIAVKDVPEDVKVTIVDETNNELAQRAAEG